VLAAGKAARREAKKAKDGVDMEIAICARTRKVTLTEAV
jgi:hypothetical protein